MSRYDTRIAELTADFCGFERAKELALAEECERTTDALERIATALEGSSSKIIFVDLPQNRRITPEIIAEIEKVIKQR